MLYIVPFSLMNVIKLLWRPSYGSKMRVLGKTKKYFLLTAEILISYVSRADAVIQILENYLFSVNNVKFNESLM